MYETFLAPSEKPTTSLDIKKAILTYDRVLVSDPSDRDYFPPQFFLQAMGAGLGIPFFPIGINSGPIRPLGKFKNYDNDFDKIMEEIDYARREGVVDVISTYDLSAGQGMTIGGIPDGGYPLNPAFMLWAYRNIAHDQQALFSAVDGDIGLTEDFISEAASLKGIADSAVNDSPELPLMQHEMVNPDYRTAYTLIARSRIANTMKSIGYCAAKNLVPTFSNHQAHKLLHLFSERSNKVLGNISREDPSFSLRSRVLELSHREYINEDVLNEMPLDEVLKLRTKAWGKQAENRDALLKSAALLSQDCQSSIDFDNEVTRQIREYRHSWDDVLQERRRLNFDIGCDMATGATKTAGAFMAGELAGAVAQVQSGIGAATMLFAGCLLAIEKIKDYKPVLDNIRNAELEFGDHACFGINNFYASM